MVVAELGEALTGAALLVFEAGVDVDIPVGVRFITGLVDATLVCAADVDVEIATGVKLIAALAVLETGDAEVLLVSQ